MGLFTVVRREDRLAAAAAALGPYGFTFDPRFARRLEQYLPLREVSAPEEYVTACFGRIEDALVEGYEYQYSTRDSEGGTSWTTTTLVAVLHPSIRGGASFAPDMKHWSGFAAALDTLFWVPPFTFLKAIQYANEARNPDRIVGDAEFDRLYLVHAESDEHARQAIPPALREAVVRMYFRGSVELRPGVLLYSPHELRFDAETAVSAIGAATVMLGALRSAEQLRAHPMR